MPKYTTNIRGNIRGMVQGNGQTIIMDGSGITSINGRTQIEIQERYRWALAHGASERAAREYASCRPEEEEIWQDYFE